MSLAKCSVPLTTLTAAPYNLIAGNSISVKITALNSIASSPYSAVGNGAILAFSTVPNAPKLLTRDELLTTTSRIGFNWSDGDSNGGQPVLDYRVSFQNLGIYEVIASGVT